VVYPSRMLRPVFGEMTKLGRPVPAPAAYYRGALRQVAEPGTRYTYTDHGSPHSATSLRTCSGSRSPAI
jgi:hypothetical protein